MADRNHIWRDSVRRGVGAPGIGVSTGGNTAGSTGTGQMGTMVLAGVGGITLSQSAAPGGQSTISISGLSGAGIGAAAQSAFTATNLSTVSAGTVVFSNTTGFGPNIAATQSWGGGIAFGVSGSTITANAPGAVAQILVQTGAASTDTQFVGVQRSNSISIEKAGNINLSVVAGDAFRIIGQAVAFSAGTQLATSGTVSAADGNGISFGLSNTSVLTASHNAVSQLAVHDASGNQVNNGVPRLAFSNVSNGNITFGKSVIANTFHITASAKEYTISAWENAAAAAQIGGNYRQGTEAPFIWFQRQHMPMHLLATRFDWMMSISSANTQQAASHTFRFGIYTMSGSTASLASTGSRTFAYNSTLGAGNVNNISNCTAYNIWSIPVTMTFTPGDYLMAFVGSISTGGTSAGYTINARRDITLQGIEFSTGPMVRFGEGMYSLSTGNFPSSVHVSDIVVSTGTVDGAHFFPWCRLWGTF